MTKYCIIVHPTWCKQKQKKANGRETDRCHHACIGTPLIMHKVCFYYYADSYIQFIYIIFIRYTILNNIIIIKMDCSIHMNRFVNITNAKC